jgi:hypothetical protein
MRGSAHSQSASRSPSPNRDPINIRIKPVQQIYNSKQNKNKFCMPCGEPSARGLEQTFVVEEKLKEIEKIKNNKAGGARVSNKVVVGQVQDCAKRAFPHDARQ